MATQLLKTVKPAGGDYTSLEACMNANEQNLVTADKYFDVEIDGDWSGGADTTAVTIHNYTTDATRYINIYTTATARHKGVWSTSYYRLQLALSLETNTNLITISNNYVTINGIQTYATGGGGSWLNFYSIANEGNYDTIKNCILRGGVTTAGHHVGYVQNNSNLIDYIYNNVFYGFVTTSGNGNGLQITSGNGGNGTSYIYNNTIYGCTIGFLSDTNRNYAVRKNNIFNDNTTDISGGREPATPASTYNITNDAPSSVICFGVTADSGTTDGSAAGKLIQSGQNFLTTCKVGMVVKNTTDTTYSYITAVDSDTQLTLNDDIMANAEAFTIYTNMYGNVLFVNEGAGTEDLHLQSTDTVAKDKGANLYADATIAITTDIDGDARPDSATTFDIGADEYVGTTTTTTTSTTTTSTSTTTTLSTTTLSTSTTTTETTSTTLSTSTTTTTLSTSTTTTTLSTSTTTTTLSTSTTTTTLSTSTTTTESTSTTTTTLSTSTTTTTESTSTTTTTLSTSTTTTITTTTLTTTTVTTGRTFFIFENDVIKVYVKGTEVARFKDNGDIDGNGVFNDNAF